jgi:hypothetical protein
MESIARVLEQTYSSKYRSRFYVALDNALLSKFLSNIALNLSGFKVEMLKYDAIVSALIF